MPIVEFATFPASDALLADPQLTKPAMNIISKATGFISAYSGLQTGDQKIVHLAIAWESVDLHMRFQASPLFAEASSLLKPALGGPPSMKHVAFESGHNAAFDAPVTELALSILKEGKTKEDLAEATTDMFRRLASVPGVYLPAAYGAVVEEPRNFYLAVGWESVEVYKTAASKEEAKTIVAKLFEAVDVSAIHVTFTKCSTWAEYLGPVQETGESLNSYHKMEDYPISQRILVLSSSLKIGYEFVRCVREFSGRLLNEASLSADDGISSISTNEARIGEQRQREGNIRVPWTISNRYYSADIHFSVETMDHAISLQKEEEQRQIGYNKIPAIIFAWAVGEPYEYYAKQISKWQERHGCEPEVALAVKVLSPSTAEEYIVSDFGEDNTDIDSNLMALGFEYIDATSDQSISQSHTEDVWEGAVDGGIPRLPRVLDALSTIMWPSMRRSQKEAKIEASKKAKEPEYSLEELIARDPARLLAELEAMLPQLEGQGGPQSHWNYSSFNRSEDLWRAGAIDDQRLTIPSASEASSFSPFGMTSEIGAAATSSETGLGFDDDFSSFVSAPAAGGVAATTNDTLHLTSVPSFEELSPAGYLPLDLALSTLGEASHDVSNHSEDKGYLGLEREESGHALQLPTGQSSERSNAKLNLETGSVSDNDDFEIPYGTAEFDLEQMMDGLQQFKLEIEGMKDGEERRKAAARVALSLVYGLEVGDQEA